MRRALLLFVLIFPMQTFAQAKQTLRGNDIYMKDSTGDSLQFNLNTSGIRKIISDEALQFVVNNSQIGLHLKADGSIGLGTAVPATLFDIQLPGASLDLIGLRVQRDYAGANSVPVLVHIDEKNASSQRAALLIDNKGTGIVLNARGQGGSDIIVVESGGDVGFGGVTDPTEELHVSGAVLLDTLKGSSNNFVVEDTVQFDSHIRMQQKRVSFIDSTWTATQINTESARLAGLGGGKINFGPGIFSVSDTSILIRPKVEYIGSGHAVTEFKLANSQNRDVFRTAGHDTLTGTTKWLVSDGVVYGFAVKDMRINGNKANNTSGHGINLFWKRGVIENVQIYNCAQIGFRSECGNGSGQTTVDDMPESRISSVWVWESDSTNVLYLGPHDGFINNLDASTAGHYGFRNDKSGNHDGTVNIGEMHVYSSTKTNIQIDAPMKAMRLEAESGYEAGIVVNNAEVQIAEAQLYNNNRTASDGNYSLEINQTDVKISNLIIKDENGKGGLNVTANSAQVGNASIVGTTGDNAGVRIAANRAFFKGEISGYTGNQGIGINFGPSSARSLSHIEANILDCDTLFRADNWGAKNFVQVAGFTNAGQKTYVGANPSASSHVAIFSDGTETKKSRNTYTGSFAIDATGIKTVTITHDLIVTPTVDDVQVSIAEVTDVDDWAYDLLKIDSVSSTQITIKINVATASATGSATAKIVVKAKTGN